MSERPTVELFFDYNCPQSFIVWERLKRLSGEVSFQLTLIPVSLDHLREVYNWPPLSKSKEELKATLFTCALYAQKKGMQFLGPKNYPFKSHVSLKVSQETIMGEHQLKTVNKLMNAAWTDEVDLSIPDQIKKCLDQIGLKGEDILTQSSLPSKKKLLDEAHSYAKDNNIFSTPSLKLKDFIFCGLEQYSYFEGYLKTGELDIGSYRKLRAKFQI